MSDMNTPDKEHILRNCAHCTGLAKIDYSKGYRNFVTGVTGYGVSIDCTLCDSNMFLCYSDFPGTPKETVQSVLVRVWNTRPELMKARNSEREYQKRLKRSERV